MEYEKSSEPPKPRSCNKALGFYGVFLPSFFLVTATCFNAFLRYVEPEHNTEAKIEYSIKKQQDDELKKRKARFDKNKEKVVNYLTQGQFKADGEMVERESK